MKQFLARLNPMERRFVVGVVVVLFLVVNVVWVWPHFGEWGKTKASLAYARKTNDVYQAEINKLPQLQEQLKKLQMEGQSDVPQEDQAVQFFRVIQNQASQSGVLIQMMSSQRQLSNTNNPFFVEQNQTITLQAGEKQLVDFLYNLGAGVNSLVRVKVLSVQPDQSRQQLTARVTLVASYQRKQPLARGATTAPAAAPTKTAPPAPAASKPAPPPAKPEAPKPVTPGPATSGPPKLPSHIPALPGPATNKPKSLTPTKQ